MSRGCRGALSFQVTEPGWLWGKSLDISQAIVLINQITMGGLTSLTSGFSYVKWWSSFLPHRIVKTK